GVDGQIRAICNLLGIQSELVTPDQQYAAGFAERYKNQDASSSIKRRREDTDGEASLVPAGPGGGVVNALLAGQDDEENEWEKWDADQADLADEFLDSDDADEGDEEHRDEADLAESEAGGD
ncbi:unnamed protein product, partial [Amoebophrya sp. A25]